MRTLALVVALAACAACTPAAHAQTLPDPLANPGAFADPPVEARPKTRWWWAPPYDAKELAEEVDAIAGAGFGGAEVAFNTEGWANAEQRDGLKVALDAAQRNGIRLDMTLGASWPVTTPATDVSTGLSEQEVYYGRRDLAGPSTYSGPAPPPGDDPPNSKGAKLIAVTAARVIEAGPPVLAPAPGPNPGRPVAAPERSTILDPASLVDLTSKTDASGNVTFDVPEGEWILFGFWQRPSSENVMDHFNADSARAVTGYIDEHQLGASNTPLLPGAARDFFEDSLELDVTELMWTGRFGQEFRARRGYDLAKYLPVLFVQGQHHYPVPNPAPPADFDLPDGLGARVRTDYQRTLTDLYVDEHMVPFQRWAERHGMRFRTQPAFGASLDVTRSSRELAKVGALADDESLNAGDPAPLGDSNWRFAMDHYRSVAGGVHQGGGREISTELGAMFFRDQQASLELYKALMDKEWAAGITRPIIHGFAFQPPDSGWPGRNQFSSIVAQSWNHRAFPQWAMFRPLNDYWARGNMVLQQGRPQVDVAVYRDGFVTTAATYQALATDVPNYQVDPSLPFGVFTTPEGGQRVDDAAKLKPVPLFDGLGLERAGYTFEFIDPLGLHERAAVGDGVLYPDGPGYRVLVIDERALPGATAEAILRAARKGLRVVVVGEPPSRGTSLRDAGAEDRDVRAAVRDLLAEPTVRRARTQGGVDEALEGLDLAPAARWPRSLPVYTHHRRTAKADYYYLWNAGSKAEAFTGDFRAEGPPSALDLWSGAIDPVAVFRDEGGRVHVPLTLQPGETRVLAFRRGAARGHVRDTDAEEVVARGGTAEVRDTRGGERRLELSDGAARTVELAQPPAPVSPARWKLHVEEAGPEGNTPHDLELDALRDWREIDELQYASGAGTYTTTFTLPATQGAYLDLGTVHGAVQVFLNGRRVAPDLVHESRVDVGDLVREGENELRVELTTTLKNRLVGLGRQGHPSGALYLIQPATQPYGLIGPVRVVPFATARLALPSAARRCSSRRRFPVHVRARPGMRRVRTATVRIGKRTRRVRVRRVGRRLRAVVDLRGRPRGTVRVRVTFRGARGRAVRTSRTYRLCAKRPR